MSKVQLNSFEWKSFSLTEAEELGVNMLRGKRPKITALSEEPVTYEIERDFGDHNLDFLTDDARVLQHVDFRGAPFCFTYDIGSVENVEMIDISGYATGGGNYAMKDFELYCSDSEEDLFKAENMLTHYTRTDDDEFNDGPFYYRDWVYNVSGSMRFLGYKANDYCPSDDILRISRIAAFSKFHTYQLELSEKLSSLNCVKNFVPQVSGEYIGRPEYLTNGRAFFADEVVTAKSDVTVEFKSDKPLVIDKVILLGSGLKNTTFSCCGKEIKAELSTEDSFNGLKLYTFCFDCTQMSNCFEILLKSGAVIDAVITDTATRMADVKFKDVVVNDFLGAGSDVFPNAFSDYGIREGYNEVYWEMEKHHISKVRPHCVRMWFQIDWVVQTLEQYKSGDWQFNNDCMNSVLKYCEAFQQYGVEVELNFGWKIGKAIQDWFPIGGLDNDHLVCAAPADLENYGKACAATLEYLIIDNGFDNVKYVSFYNEPTASTSYINYDFAMNGDNCGYWAAMLRYAHYYIEHSRVKGLVEIWAAEQSASHVKWMDALNILAPDCFSRHTIHKYSLSYDEICRWYQDSIVPHSDGKPIVLTEYGNSNRKTVSWACNHINNIMAGATYGVCGAFIWVMAGSPLVDPLNWMHCSGIKGCADSSYEHWDFLPHCETLDEIGESFYEYSLITNYIPNHAKSVKCENRYNVKDCRINAFKFGGDYTICVENRGTVDTKIDLILDTDVDRKFYKYVYTRQETGTANMIIPDCERTLTVGNNLCDELKKGEYSFTVYSTIPPVRQVIMENCDLRVKAGSKVAVSATVMGCKEVPQLEISKSLCDGAILENGVVTIPASAKVGEMLSVKASISTGEFGIAIIRVI